MNKKVKKLSLNRETVRNLEGNDLRGVVGGITTGRACSGTCPPTNVSDCQGTCWSCECTASGCPSGISDCC